VAKRRFDLWNTAKKIFLRAGKAQKTLRRFAADQLGDSENVKLIFEN
jgi:hypothetical protein